MKIPEKTVATAARIEVNEDTGEMYIVFQITDEEFKNKIKKDWMQDIELKLIGKSLIKKQ